jgi:hypothetical protein
MYPLRSIRGETRPNSLQARQAPSLAEVVDTLVEKFGDGVSGQWRVPGEFGSRVTVTKGRCMRAIAADEENRIELPNRRAGRFGSFARGFFVWNSEVGKTTLGAGFFLFDYVCCNRIIWGADQYTDVRIRHTKGAPDRWLEEVKDGTANSRSRPPRPFERPLPRFAADSTLEESGFELLVPPVDAGLFGRSRPA